MLCIRQARGVVMSGDVNAAGLLGFPGNQATTDARSLTKCHMSTAAWQCHQVLTGACRCVWVPLGPSMYGLVVANMLAHHDFIPCDEETCCTAPVADSTG